jgi:hypothetical protein
VIPLPKPKIPTENLYKFAAVGGTMLVIATIFVWAMTFRELMRMSHEFHLTSDVLHVKHTFIIGEGEHLGMSFADLQTNHPEDWTDPKKQALERRWEDLREKWLPMSVEGTYLEWFQRVFYFVTGFCLLVLAFGATVATWGYRRWYERVQVHEDARLAAGTTGPKSDGEPTS